MYGNSDMNMYASFANPPAANSAQQETFHMAVDSNSPPGPAPSPPPFQIRNNSSASHAHALNMGMPNVSQSQLEIPHGFPHQLYHTQYSPHHMNIPGPLASLQEQVLLRKPVMSSQPQQSFAISENVANSAFGSQNSANPRAFSPQDCPNPEVRGSEIAGVGAVEEEENIKRNFKESVQKKRAKNWSKVEISTLAKLRCEREQKFEKGARKAELWEEIAEGLKSYGIFRDSHQCRDKWEKHMAAYNKWLKEGGKGREDNALFGELRELLEEKTPRREMEQGSEAFLEDANEERFLRDCQYMDEEETDVDFGTLAGRKRKRPKYGSVSDLSVVKELVETFMDSYHGKMKELFEVVDRRAQVREQARLEKEDRWRQEDFAQREAFNNTLLALVQNLACDHSRNVVAPTAVAAPAPQSQLKKRSRNWKKQEVKELIKLRGEMECRFAAAARRLPLWEELSDQLVVKGINRDAKQCKEKWDKLLADYKEVVDGKKEAASSHFFPDMEAVLGRQHFYLENVHENTSMQNVHENTSMQNVHENASMQNVHPEDTSMQNVHESGSMQNVHPENTSMQSVHPENNYPQDISMKNMHPENDILSNGHPENDIVGNAHPENDIVDNAHPKNDIADNAHLENDILDNAHLENDILDNAHPLNDDIVDNAHTDSVTMESLFLENVN